MQDTTSSQACRQPHQRDLPSAMQGLIEHYESIIAEERQARVVAERAHLAGGSQLRALRNRLIRHTLRLE